MQNASTSIREQQREKNLKIIKDFPFLLTIGSKRHLLTDDIIVGNTVKKVDGKNVYFCLERTDLPLLALFNIVDFKADILIHYQGRTMVGVTEIKHQGSGKRLAEKIFKSVPEKCKISHLAVIDGNYILCVLFHDIIIYRGKDDLRPIIETALNAETKTEGVRNHISG